MIATYGTLLDALQPLGLSYLSVVHHWPTGALVEHLAARFSGPLVINTGFATLTALGEAAELIDAPFVDAVAVGRAVLANPDLVERWKTGESVNEPRYDLFYTHDEVGYTDYPVSVAS